MVGRHLPRARRLRLLAPMLATAAMAGATVGFAGSSGADVSAAAGGAFGASLTVSVSGGPPTTSAPRPSVELPPAGGDVSDAAPSTAVNGPSADAPFGGRFLDTGALAVSSKGATDAGGSSTGAASVGDVAALGGILRADAVASTCASDEAGATASATLTRGTLLLSAGQSIDLPGTPAPNTTLRGFDAASGDTFTVILNEQTTDAGSRTTNAVHVVLDGPSAVGDIRLAQTRCALTAASVTVTPSSLPPSGPPPAASTATPTDAAQATSADAATPAAEEAGAEPVTAAAIGNPTRLGAATVTEVTGSAFGYYTNVGFFGGNPVAYGPEPTVALPKEGSATAITATIPSAKASYGPAKIFQSKRIDVSTQGTTGPTGSVNSSVSIVEEPSSNSPFKWDKLESTCSAVATGASGSATITNGTVTVKTDEDGQPLVTEPVPVNPAPNTEKLGTIDNVGDKFRIVFNEQKTDNGTLTVNAVHMYLLGEIAVGEMIAGQSVCGVKASSVATTTTSPGSTSTTAPGTTGGPGGTGGVESAQSAAEAAQVAAGTLASNRSSTGAQSTAAAGGQSFAKTGLQAPLLPGLALVLAGWVALFWSRRLQPRGGPRPDGRR